MPRMTPEQEAEYALDFGVARSDLPQEAQLAYDRLVEQQARLRPPAPAGDPGIVGEIEVRLPLLLRIWAVLFALFCVISLALGIVRAMTSAALPSFS